MLGPEFENSPGGADGRVIEGFGCWKTSLNGFRGLPELAIVEVLNWCGCLKRVVINFESR